MLIHAPLTRRVTRREAAVIGAVLGGTALTAACDTSRKAGPPGTGTPAAGSRSAAAPAGAADSALQQRAVADERRLLEACAAPPGVEPFATLRRVHLDHLQRLTGTRPDEPAPAPKAPAREPLAQAERSAAVARRTDCVRASAGLASLLAIVAASEDVAGLVLT